MPQVVHIHQDHLYNAERPAAEHIPAVKAQFPIAKPFKKDQCVALNLQPLVGVL
jgi:hypothetical protein